VSAGDYYVVISVLKVFSRGQPICIDIRKSTCRNSGLIYLKVRKQLIIKRRKYVKAVILLGATIGVTACTGPREQQISEPIELKGEAIPVSNLKKKVVKVNLNEQVEYARTDLSKRLGVELDSISLANARAVTWRSGALGCPKPGMAYTDALVPGTLIFLKAGNSLHAYHSKRDGLPFYCPRERVESPVLDKTQDVT